MGVLKAEQVTNARPSLAPLRPCRCDVRTQNHITVVPIASSVVSSVTRRARVADPVGRRGSHAVSTILRVTHALKI